jgi:hypothetical protein
MNMLKFDHFITAIGDEQIDPYLEEYREAGFQVEEQTVQHHPGLLNGFIHFGPEYLEFVSVEDEELFEQGADTAPFPDIRNLRAAQRPFAIGIVSDDVQALHDTLTERGYTVPGVTGGGPRDAEPGAQPVWSFLALPPILEGALCFALTYHSRSEDAPRKVRIAPNTTFAISGVTFASDAPEERAKAWRDLLAPGGTIEQQEDGDICETSIPPHFAVWMKPEKFQDHYGFSWKASPHPYGELSVIHLLAQDLDRASQMLEAAGRSVTLLPDKRTGVDTLYVSPDPRDGFTFAITQRPAQEWLNERTAATGEKLELE